MRFGEAKLSTAETDVFLQRDCFEPGTGAYERERRRRYRPVGRDRWGERDEWDPSAPPPAAFYTGKEVEMIIRRLRRDPSVDILYERSRLFDPCSPDPEDDRWVKKGEWSSVYVPEPAAARTINEAARKAVGTGFAFVA